jgi:inositol phosphorylceramide mannosyltransferase catalytic subunit
MMHSFLRQGLQPSRQAILTSIPYTIWQVTNPQRLSDSGIAAAIDRLRTQNPDWVHNCLMDHELDGFFEKVGSDRLLRAVRRLAPEYPQARIDIYRYLQLFLAGGVYFDDKCGVSSPLSTIVRPDDSFLISQHGAWKKEGFVENLRSRIGHVEGGEFLNWFIASAPGHPFLAQVLETVLYKIETYSPLFSGTGKRAVLELTGPMMYTKTIEPMRRRHPHRMVAAEAVGLQYSVLPHPWSHETIAKGHYSALYSPPVVGNGLGPLRRCRFEVEKVLVKPVSAIRSLNGERLRRRRAKKQSA